MDAYCNTCHASHAAWTRLNDGENICGRCGTRHRRQRIIPLNAHLIPRTRNRKATPGSLLHFVS